MSKRTSIDKYPAPDGKTWRAISNHGEVLEHPELAAIFRTIGQSVGMCCKRDTWTFELVDIHPATRNSVTFPVDYNLAV